MKNKIKEGLKTKYSNKGLSDSVFDGVANFLLVSKNITAEDQIETAIAGPEIEGMLTALQSDFDKIRREKAGLESQLQALKDQKPTDPPTPPTPPVPPVPPTTSDPLLDHPVIKSLATALPVVTDFITKMQGKEKNQQILTEAMTLRQALKLDEKQKAWIDDAWNGATNNITETDTPQNIVDRFKTRYDEYMNRLGTNGYVPAEAGPQNPPESNTAKIVKEQFGKDAPGQTKSPADLFGGQKN